ncbi:unnamed protein product [Rotaria sp. Silwood2]|nr:unnamed protein product [Rotaria sp. Silwood2]CAF2974004.1 unnamed protein product [Rotaria sp. Silwood2]CAF3548410.1 unnamed protein product [Rotaria sp. Silwood2]CAF4018796.1 unnamed protein product [Rotaria sp. Silwood2]CAF4095796.1 unnamed protein product [Rotaria sp. Silwood2]
MLYEQFTSNNNREQKENSSNVNAFFDVLGKVNKFFYYTFSLPMKIYEDFVDNIYNLVVNHSTLFSCCLCTTITATVSVTSIAVGVGVGSGIGCFPSDSTSSNSTTG